MSIASGSLGGVYGPGRNGRLIGDEEVVEVPGDETGCGLLPAYDINDILAVEVAPVSEEGLLAVVMVFRTVVEVVGDSTVRPV